jgi:CO dehydrogenase/acetyl-CoA synthase gamma subunit (corrinoid Fe-S protein)
MHASDDAIRRAIELALEHDVTLRLSAHGDVEVLGRLGASSRKSNFPAEVIQPATTTQPGAPDKPAAPQVRCLVGEGFQLQRAIRRQDLVPQKRVAYEMGVSQTTLWRASRSDLPDFPPPVVIRKKVYWRKADLAALEDALMYFQGRGVFERRRRETGGS